MTKFKIPTKIFLTTPLFYPSGNPHLGHAYTIIIADIIQRTYKQMGSQVFLLTGTDNHGQKNLNLANSSNLTPTEYITPFVKKFQMLLCELNVIEANFIETSKETNKSQVQIIFQKFQKQKKIYFDYWNSNYCTECEEDYTSNITTCIHGHKLQLKSEPSYFFNVKSEQKWLLELYNKKNCLLWPKCRIQELKNNFLNELQDLAITRQNLTWGVKLLNDSNTTIYVWFEALCNYLNGTTKWPDANNNETKIIQIIGKEIVRFHAIYWPIILKLLNKALPDKLLSHGWIIAGDKKMSKSLDNSIVPNKLLSWLQVDCLRYFFSHLNWSNDIKFDEEKLYNFYHNNIVNTYLNLVHRFLGLLKKFGLPKKSVITPWDEIIINAYNEYPEFVVTENIPQILETNQSLINHANTLIEQVAPWNLSKNDPNILALLIYLGKLIRWVTWVFQPIMTKLAQEIAEHFAWINMQYNDLDPILGIEIKYKAQQLITWPKYSREEWHIYYVSAFKTEI